MFVGRIALWKHFLSSTKFGRRATAYLILPNKDWCASQTKASTDILSLSGMNGAVKMLINLIQFICYIYYSNGCESALNEWNFLRSSSSSSVHVTTPWILDNFSVRCSFEQKNKHTQIFKRNVYFIANGHGLWRHARFAKNWISQRNLAQLWESSKGANKSWKQNRCLQAKLNYPSKVLLPSSRRIVSSLRIIRYSGIPAE